MRKKSDPLIHGTVLLKLSPDTAPPFPEPSAASFPDIHPSAINDLDIFSTGTPVSRASLPYLTGQPMFFRTVVPPLFVDFPEPGTIARHRDTPSLRHAVQSDVNTLLERFSPARSIATAPPIKIEKMPVVKEALAPYSKRHFADCDLIAVQHLYSQTVGMLQEMHAHGLAYARTTVIGKSYSTNYSAARAMQKLGIRVPLGTLEQHQLESHHEVMKKTIREELERYRAKVADGTAKPTLLVLDEGGQVVELLHTEFRDLLSRVVAVEQTTKGLIRLANLEKLEVPLVKLCRARVKTEIESRLIGLSIFYDVYKKLLHLETCGLPKDRVISINGGGGVVGRQVAAAFADRGYRVRIYDKDPVDPKSLPPNVELIEDRDAFLRGANVMISVTGAAPISLPDYRLVPNGAKLFNGASADDELGAKEAIAAARLEQPAAAWWDPISAKNKAEYVRGMPDLLADREHVLPQTGWLWGEMMGSIIPLGHVARGAQRDRVLHFADKDIFLANGGFVTNLGDVEDPIPPRFIQITRAGLAAACAEALNHRGSKPELKPLSEDAEALIAKQYRAELGADFDRPSWIPKWARKPATITAFAGTPKMPPELAPFCDGVIFPSPSHVLANAGDRRTLIIVPAER